jgi:hypothetical protein
MRRVVTFLSFYVLPKPYWWRPVLAPNELFDLDDAAHVQFLQRNGVMRVKLEDGQEILIPPFGSGGVHENKRVSTPDHRGDRL